MIVTVTEKFKQSIKFILEDMQAHFESSWITRDRILNVTLEHKGKRYALKIVELDAELPKYDDYYHDTGRGIPRYDFARRSCWDKAQFRMLSVGWVKRVEE